MAQYVIAGADAANALTQTVVGMADAASHIQDVATKIAAVSKEQMRNENNEYNIRNQFLENAVNAIKEATCSQFNIVICTDQNKDDFQNLTGQILPMNLLNLEIAPGKMVDFQIYVFDTGNYLRHGKYEPDYWQFWGQSKKWYDPAAMHVDFKKAQKKLDPSQVAAANAAKAKTNATSAAAAAAITATQKTAAVTNAATVATDGTNPDGTPAPPPSEAPTGLASPTSSPPPSPGLPPSTSAGTYPSFTSHMMGAMAGPAMQMISGSTYGSSPGY